MMSLIANYRIDVGSIYVSILWYARSESTLDTKG